LSENLPDSTHFRLDVKKLETDFIQIHGLIKFLVEEKDLINSLFVTKTLKIKSQGDYVTIFPSAVNLKLLLLHYCVCSKNFIFTQIAFRDEAKFVRVAVDG